MLSMKGRKPLLPAVVKSSLPSPMGEIPGIPDLAGKVIYVTGGTAGIGRETVIALARHNPSHIYLSGCSATQAASVINYMKASIPDANLTFIECDLASLASVHLAARQFISSSNRLDLLFVNAGIVASSDGLTVDGYEVQFGCNHLGHALLVKLLLPTLLRTAHEPGADVRIICNTSLDSKSHPKNGIDFDDLRTTRDCQSSSTWQRYGQSKLATILYAAELARRYPAITSVVIHPGAAATCLASNLSCWKRALVCVTNPRGLMTPAEGARNQVWAATVERSKITNGGHYQPGGVPDDHDGLANSEKLAGELWTWTQKELDAYRI